jgi:hypothetical protein
VSMLTSAGPWDGGCRCVIHDKRGRPRNISCIECSTISSKYGQTSLAYEWMISKY